MWYTPVNHTRYVRCAMFCAVCYVQGGICYVLCAMCYGVATISRLLKITGLFCGILSLLQGPFAKETYNFTEPTNRNHIICAMWYVLCAMHHLQSYEVSGMWFVKYVRLFSGDVGLFWQDRQNQLKSWEVCRAILRRSRARLPQKRLVRIFWDIKALLHQSTWRIRLFLTLQGGEDSWDPLSV